MARKRYGAKKGSSSEPKRGASRTRAEKRRASPTWRRPRSMPMKVWEEVNENMDREMVEWARGLLLADDEGNVRRLTEEEVQAIAKAGQWSGASRARRRQQKKA